MARSGPPGRHRARRRDGDGPKAVENEPQSRHRRGGVGDAQPARRSRPRHARTDVRQPVSGDGRPGDHRLTEKCAQFIM